MKINIIQFPNGFRHKFVVNCFPSLLWFHCLLSVSLVLVLFACLFVLHQKKKHYVDIIQSHLSIRTPLYNGQFV